ncbi:AtpZ/AtpI family protein [Bacillus smithii]|uniref:AtpZ/AtpI family protein n=1 Tax=Bacillus smithii TaxID=1479 RepID=UPI003D1DCD9E
MAQKQHKSPFRAMALYSTILSQLAGSVLIGIFLGRWIDGKCQTEPLFLVIGLLSGLAAGILAMLRTIRHFDSGD